MPPPETGRGIGPEPGHPTARLAELRGEGFGLGLGEAAEGGPGTGDACHRAIGRFDHATGEMALWRAPAGCAVSEPVFAPRPGSQAEGDGWLLSVVYRGEEKRSDLAIFEATDIGSGPIALAHLTSRVPAGFHGNWRPGSLAP